MLDGGCGEIEFLGEIKVILDNPSTRRRLLNCRLRGAPKIEQAPKTTEVRPLFHNRFQRFGIAFVGLMVASQAILLLWARKPYYQNWWGGLLFAPFGIAIGLGCILIAVIKKKNR